MNALPWRLAGDHLAALADRTAIELHTSSGASGPSPSALTYAELALRAAGVFRQLRRVDALPGDPVAILSSGRAFDEVIALTGILTSGAVAVPLDAAAPAQRLASILRARGCSVIVHDAPAAALIDAVAADLARPDQPEPIALSRLTLDAQGAVVSTRKGASAHPRGPSLLGPIGDVACVLHTSGSTGAPKPIPITWAGLDAFTAWTIDLLRLTSSDRVLRVAELIFDLAWFDHLATLRAGASLVMMSRRDLAAGAALREAIRALRPTVVYGVPSLFMKLTAALPPGEPVPAPIRAVLFAGEVFPPRELAAFADRVPDASLFNVYGPTETNVCTYHAVDRAHLDGVRETPIGLACPYAHCHLVEETEGPPPRVIEGPGVGELVVSGPTTVGGGPYPTRDRVERGPDGLFYFRGRIDRMVKIRGYRVEPGEVEVALSAHPSTRAAAVIVVDDPRLGKTLRAFVELRPGEPDPGERALRMHLAERLPPYMVPEKVVVIDELPRTSTGKIDYSSLSRR